MADLQHKFIDKVFLVDEDDFVYAFFKLLEPLVRGWLNNYRQLKKELEEARRHLQEAQERKNVVSKELQELRELIPQKESQARFLALIGLLALLILVAVAAFSSVLAFLLFFVVLIILIYAFSLHSTVNSLKDTQSKLSNELNQLDIKIQQTSNKVQTLNEKIRSYGLPRLQLRAYKCYIPVAVVKSPLGKRHVVISPWSPGRKFAITYVSDFSAIEEARGRIALGESLYFDAALRGKDAGYKVIESFKKMNLWEKVIQSKSPERVLKEIIEESYNLVKSALERGEEVIRLEPVDKESLKLLIELSKNANGARPQSVLKESVQIVKSEVEKLEVIAEAVRQLSGLRKFVKEALELAARREVYASIVDLAVREMIARTMPFEPMLFNLFLRTLFCNRCADHLLSDYVPQLDLRKWVYSEILGGVDSDPDIVSPDEEVRDIVVSAWNDLDEKIYRELPLPGAIASDPLDELKAKYEAALREFALAFTGAEERLEVNWVSAFQPPVVRCARCGQEIDVEGSYHLLNLRLPIIKGYSGLLAEKQGDLLTRSSEIVSSVNSARLHKDERKTTVGIYKQMVQSMEQEVTRLELEANEAELHKKSLLAVLVPIIATPAVQVLVRELSSYDPSLRDRLQKVASTSGGKL